MNIGFQILDTILAQLIFESSLALSSLVGTAIPALVVLSITVHIHVVVSAAVPRTMKEDGTINVPAVSECLGAIDSIREAPGKFVVAISRPNFVRVEDELISLIICFGPCVSVDLLQVIRQIVSGSDTSRENSCDTQ